MTFSRITITGIDCFAKITITPGERRKIVNRVNNGLAFAPTGLIKYMQNGKEYINDSNHILFLPEKGDYTIEYVEGDICFLINFQCNESFSEIMSFNISNSDCLLEQFEFFSTQLIFNKSDVYCGAMSYLYSIFEKIMIENPSYGSKLPAILNRAMQYINQNYTNCELSNEMVANSINVSNVYFRKIFKEYFHETPKKYIRGLRIRQAKVLLANQFMNVEQIAECCGFSSIYSFSRSFKEIVGYSPNEYRKLQRYPISCCGTKI